MYHLPLISFMWDLCIHTNYIQITWTDTIWGYSKFENLEFFINFLNKDISFNILSICWKFAVCVDESHLKGSVSHIFDLGLSYNS